MQKDQKTKLTHSKDEDVLNKAYLDKKLTKIECHLSISEIEYNENKVLLNNQSVEEVLIRRAVERLFEYFYDESLFDILPMLKRF